MPDDNLPTMRHPSEGFRTSPGGLDRRSKLDVLVEGAVVLACVVLAFLLIFVFVALLAGCGSTAGPAAPTGSTALPATAASTPAQASKCVAAGGLPDRSCTPGETNPDVTQADIASTICRAGWTATVRPSVSYTDRLKVVQMAAYGDTGPASAYEEDHLVPLELGGSPTDPRNLWPELWAGPTGAHAKDAVENRVKREVCSGQLSLAAGQAIFEADWQRG